MVLLTLGWFVTRTERHHSGSCLVVANYPNALVLAPKIPIVTNQKLSVTNSCVDVCLLSVRHGKQIKNVLKPTSHFVDDNVMQI